MYPNSILYIRRVVLRPSRSFPLALLHVVVSGWGEIGGSLTTLLRLDSFLVLSGSEEGFPFNTLPLSSVGERLLSSPNSVGIECEST